MAPNRIDIYIWFGDSSFFLPPLASSSKRAEIGPETFGIVVCLFVGTVPGILGLVWRCFEPDSGSTGRILKHFPDPIDPFKGR